jgi:hypothetical protein
MVDPLGSLSINLGSLKFRIPPPHLTIHRHFPFQRL